MNQVITNRVYGKGTTKQVEFISEIGGMNDIEKAVLKLLHEGQTQLYIQEELGLSRSVYDSVETAVSTKVAIAVFECINYYMNNR